MQGMVRTLSALACALLLTAQLSGCSSDATGGPGAESAAPGRVVATLNSSGALKEGFPTIASMASSKSTSLIVRGRVEKVEYHYLFDLALTELTVSVSETFRGSPSAPDITVWEDGGFVTAVDLAATDAAKFPEGAPSPTDDEWVEVLYDGASHPSVGSTVVLFLNENPNESQAGSYQEVGSVYGRLTLDQAGNTYYRPTTAEGWETKIDGAALTHILEATNSS